MKKFEEYSLFVNSTDRLSDRRQQMSNTYLTVNSIIIGAIAFLLKDSGLEGSLRFVFMIVTLTIGIIVCRVWKQLLFKYKELIGLRIDELRKIENHDKMKDSHKMYHTEDQLFPRDEKDNTIEGKALNFTVTEASLPNILIITYSVFLAALIIYIVYQFSFK